MDTTSARERWHAFAWQRGYLQASREVPAPPIPPLALVQLATHEGWLEAENSPAMSRQIALSLEELARLFAEQWEQGYSFRYAEVQAHQAAGMLLEAAGTG